MLAVHNKYIRRAFACMNCYRQMFPVEKRYSCGKCEYHDYCEKCWGQYHRNNNLDKLHKHYLFEDFIFPEVESDKIGQSKSIADGFINCFNTYTIRSLIGIRPVTKYNNLIEENFANDFKWLSYSQVKELALSFGSGLQVKNIEKRSFIGICGASSIQWHVSQYGIFLKGYIPVPLHASFTSKQISHIIKLANLSVLIISKHLLSQIQQLDEISKKSLQFIILMDDYSCAYSVRKEIVDNKDKITEINGIKVYYWDDIKKLGDQYDKRNEIVHITGDDIGMLLSTSGSSGMPKLTILSASRIQSSFYAAKPVNDQMCTLSIEPMRQSMDLLSKGGRCGIYCGRLDKIKEDIQCLRPTALGATPSFWNNLYCEYQQELVDFLEKNPNLNEADFLVEYHSRTLFGNRLRVGLYKFI